MYKITVKDVLLYLEQEGWSELIDSRWRQQLIQDIQDRFPNISDEILVEVLDIVLV